MQNWQFCVIGTLGLLGFGLFWWFVIKRNQGFDAPLLGLVILSSLFVGVALFQPDQIKYAGLELNRAKEDANQASVRANEAARLALETSAMLTWNAGRWGDGGKYNEELATNLLTELYGGKALDYRYALQRKKVYLTPKGELEKVPKVDFPKDINSPLYERYLKNLKQGTN